MSARYGGKIKPSLPKRSEIISYHRVIIEGNLIAIFPENNLCIVWDMLHSELKKALKHSKTIELSSQRSRFDAACPVVTGSSMQLKHDRFEL